MSWTLHTYKKKLFWWEIDIVIHNTHWFDEQTLQQKIDIVYEYALQQQKIFNFYDPTSELSILNTNRYMTVSDELLNLIKEWISMSELTEWAYDISLWKYILERKSGKPVSEQLCLYKDIIIENNTVKIRHPDAMIDLWSVAKWYITDRIAQACIDQWLESGLIDARWDIIAFGTYSERLWIQHPRDQEWEIWTFALCQQAVATSWDYNQFDTEFTQSHILHQWHDSSITVVAKTLAQADIIATALFVSDENIREKIVKKYSDIPMVCVSADMQIHIYNDRNNLFTLNTSL